MKKKATPRKRQKKKRGTRKKKPAWHEYNRALWEEPRPEKKCISNVFFFHYFSSSFFFHHRRFVAYIFVYIFFSSPHSLRFPQTDCSNSEKKSALHKVFTVNQRREEKKKLRYKSFDFVSSFFFCVSVLSNNSTAIKEEEERKKKFPHFFQIASLVFFLPRFFAR